MAKIVKYTFDENGKRSWTLEDETIPVSNSEYSSGWADDTTTAPSKAAVYAKIQTVGGGEGGGLTQQQIEGLI